MKMAAVKKFHKTRTQSTFFILTFFSSGTRKHTISKFDVKLLGGNCQIFYHDAIVFSVASANKIFL